MGRTWRLITLAALVADPSEIDILDESLTLFRANSLFRNFEIKGPADRTLIYFILFISDCISRIGSPNAKHWNTVEATKQLTTLALESFSLPGEPGFPLNSVFSAPANRTDADNLRAYLSQARQELAPRIVQTVYDETGKPSKWWMAFQVSDAQAALYCPAGVEIAVYRNDASWANPYPDLRRCLTVIVVHTSCTFESIIGQTDILHLQANVTTTN